MEKPVDPEEIMYCPYNKSHQIRRKRMQFHLVTCRKNYPNAEIVICDFNVSHHVPKFEIRYHHQHCPNRKDFEIQYMEKGQNLNKFPIQNIRAEIEESWDDCNEGTYDPKEHCVKNGVLRKLDVESAARRKQFRVTERNRLNQFSKNTSRNGLPSSYNNNNNTHSVTYSYEEHINKTLFY